MKIKTILESIFYARFVIAHRIVDFHYDFIEFLQYLDCTLHTYTHSTHIQLLITIYLFRTQDFLNTNEMTNATHTHTHTFTSSWPKSYIAIYIIISRLSLVTHKAMIALSIQLWYTKQVEVNSYTYWIINFNVNICQSCANIGYI